MGFKTKEELKQDLDSLVVLAHSRPLTKKEMRKALLLESLVNNYEAIKRLAET